MDDLEQHLSDLQAHYDGVKEDIARAEANDEPTDEFYTENFAAITDALGVANFKSNPEKAYELLKEALDLRRNKICQGRDDETVITSLNNMSILLRKMNVGKEAEAIGVYQREAVEMFCRSYPESRHLNAAANLNSLVDIMGEYQLGSKASDVRYLKMAVERFRKYIVASETARMEKKNENEEDEDEPRVDPVLIHYVSTLKKLANKGKDIIDETEVSGYLTEASRIEKMFEDEVKRLCERKQ